MKKGMIMIVMICAAVLITAAVLCFTAPKLDARYTEASAEKAMQKFGVPGIAVSVMDAEGVLYDYCGGVRAAGGDDAIAPQDYFHIGSCSKSVLAIIAAYFVEKQQIQWETRFFDIFPELMDGTDESYYNITLEDLLSCRAGIKSYTSGDEEYPDLSASSEPRLDFFRHLLSLPPAAAREGERFGHLYSNASYSLASAMLEKVSGMSYEAWIQKYIADGLGIDVAYGWPYQIGKDQPFGHLKTKEGLVPFGPEIDYHINPLIHPAGILSTTPEGFAKLALLHLTGLQKGNMLSKESWEHIDRVYQGLSLGAYNARSFGKDYVLLDGSAGTFYARAVILPESDLALTILMNSGDEKAVDYLTMRLAKAKFQWWWMFWI